MIGFITIGVIILMYSYILNEYDKKRLDARGEETKDAVLHNFPFKKDGKTYWYSRATAVTLMCFCKDKEGNNYILANQRGKGCPDFNGCWNAPCGYVDFNESIKGASIREVQEETGIIVPLEKVKPCGIDDSLEANNQNITHRFYAILDGTIEDYTFDTSNMEEDEVENVKWININDLDNYEWAFGHLNVIKSIINDLSL